MASLRVTLLRASDLVASDSALEGALSDPFVIFQVGNEIQQSSCIHQELNPEWCPRESFDFPVVHQDKDVLRIEVYDFDTFNAHDLIGTLVLPVSRFVQFANIPQHEIFHIEVPELYAAHACKSAIEVEICFFTNARDGTVTLRMWENEAWGLMTGWVPSDTEIYRRYSVYDDSATSDRFELTAPPVPDGMEGQGWGYVKDANRGDDGWGYAYNFLGPFYTDKTMNSYVRRRLWENKFHFGMEGGSDTSQTLDRQQTSEPAVARQAPLISVIALANMPPSLTATLFAVKITLSHATDLAASDYNGKSDPYVTFQLDDQHARSSCRAATCDPEWTPQEHFDFKITDPRAKQLVVKVFDHDVISKDDLLGTALIQLQDFDLADTNTKKPEMKAFPLMVPDEFHRQQCTSQLFLAVRVIPLDTADLVQEMWENECWVVGKGWYSGEGTVIHHRERWSSDDGRTSSAHFSQVAPKVPDGYESPGWSYAVGKGDPDGWFYATTFAGPWYDATNSASLVRRRKWVNLCRRVKADSSPRHSQPLRF